MPFEIVKLDPSLEHLFYRRVDQDLPHHFFFIFDWKLNRELTEIRLALRQGSIHGMMLIYRSRIAQLRGSKSAVETLLDRLDLEKVELHAETVHSELVRGKYRLIKEYELLLMTLRRGEERLASTDNVVRMTFERAEEIADLMRSANPEFWGYMDANRIAASMNRNLWLGIFVDDRIVSVGNTFLTNFASNIHTVATHESYRNRGYATAVVSALVKETLKTNDLALIHVLEDNVAARRVYEKVGFKTYRTYLYGFGELRSDY